MNGTIGSIAAEGAGKTETRAALLPVVWTVMGALAVIYLRALADCELSDVLAAALISTVALVPAYLWCSGRAFGIPIWPLASATYILGFALPLVTAHPIVFTYTSEERFDAALLVVLFLVLTTAIWYPFVSRTISTARVEKFVLPEAQGDGAFLAFIMLSDVFNIMAFSGWLNVEVEVFSLLRGIVAGLGSLGTFLLAWRWGARELARGRAHLYVIALATYMLSNATSTLLVGSMVAFLLAVIGFSLGRRRVPWTAAIVGILAFVFLHLGKGEIREKYLYGDDSGQSTLARLWDYPAFYFEWAQDSATKLSSDSEDLPGQSLLERGSLMHLLLKVETESPEIVPYLRGRTYSHIPELFIPRIIYPQKASSHEGTALLNIHYGIQTREGTETTGVGWGLLNEALANFGVAGLVVLATLLACFYGAASRWSAGAHSHSLRFLAPLLILPLCFNTEISLGAYVASLFQSFVALLGATILILKMPGSRQQRGTRTTNGIDMS